MPKHKAKNTAFGADLIGGSRCDADGLCVNHFAHDAARAVRCSHENRTQIQLLGGDSLQTSKQSVGRSIASSQRDAEPSDVRAKKWEEPTSSRERQAQDCVHA